MRLFLGIEIPQNIKEALANAYLPLQTSSKGWESSHDYHLTLLFIGEASTDEAGDIIGRMAKIKVQPFELTLKSLTFFPRRVLYQSFGPSEALNKLRDQIENEFSEWINPQAKPFLPHLTVKRYQRYEYEELKKRIEEYPVEPKSFEVTSLALFKSEKDQENRKYHIIHEEPFILPLG